MNSINIFSSENLKKQDITNSLIFHIYFKNQSKYKYFKTSNKIKTSYIDNVLKDRISVSTNGFKKNFFFKKLEINKNILDKSSKNFVCYFSLLEDHIFKFNLYSAKYFALMATNHIKDHQIILYKKNKLNKSTINSKSFFYSNYNLLINSPKNILNRNFNKLFLIKPVYKRLFFCTSSGFIKKFKNVYNNKLLFQGLSNWTNKTIKRWFKKILLLNYLLLSFYSNVLISWKKSNLLIYNSYIYKYFLNFLNYKFYNKLYDRKLEIRKKNAFLKNYETKLREKIYSTLNFYYSTVKKKIFYTLKNHNWINDLLFNENKLIFLNYSEEINLCIIKNKINTLDSKERIRILNFLYRYLKSNFLIKHSNEHSLVFDYVYLKTLFLKIFLQTNFQKTLFYYNKKLELYSTDLSFYKILNFSNNYFKHNTKNFFLKNFKLKYYRFKSKVVFKNNHLFKPFTKNKFITLKKKKSNFILLKNNSFLTNYLNLTVKILAKNSLNLKKKRYAKSNLGYSFISLLKWKKWLKKKVFRYLKNKQKYAHTKKVFLKKNISLNKTFSKKKLFCNNLNIHNINYFIYQKVLSKNKFFLNNLSSWTKELKKSNIHFKKPKIIPTFLDITYNTNLNIFRKNLVKKKQFLEVRRKSHIVTPIGITRIFKNNDFFTKKKKEITYKKITK